MEEEDFPSDSDQDDEDYNPDGHNSDVPSEVESDGDAENSDQDVTKTAKTTKPTSRKRKSKSAGTAPKGKSRKVEAPIEQEEIVEEEADKDKEDAEKKRADALWADFLGGPSDNTPAEPKKPKVSQDLSKKVESAAPKVAPVEKKTEASPAAPAPERKTITEIFEFAGEKVEVKKVVEIVEDAPSTTAVRKPGGVIPVRGALPRSSGTGGIGSILGQLGKAKKISTLEKTALDWKSFKQNEGINEELQTFNKGKDGYLERQDFLERTDFRRFEIEKGQRQTTRRKWINDALALYGVFLIYKIEYI